MNLRPAELLSLLAIGFYFGFVIGALVAIGCVA